MREAVIVAAVRSAVGRAGGALSSLQPHELGGLVVKEAVKRAKIDGAKIDEVIFGSVMSKEYNNIARVVGLESGIPVNVPAISLDRQCATSLNALAYGAVLIEAGVHDIVVAGGVDMDSKRPWIMGRVEKAFQAMPPMFLEPRVTPDAFGNENMLITAENIGRKYKISRGDCDKFAVESHKKAIKAWENGIFDEQVLPIEVNIGKGKTHLVKKDETMRESTLEDLGKLKLASGVAGGVVTAGNSSPNCDGSSAVVIMEKEMAKGLNLEILGTYRGYTSVGVDPSTMGIGPVYAIRKLLDQKRMTMDEIDLFEINEAFSTQSLSCAKELGMDMNKLNVNGGALALGHPLAATGTILTAKMVYELKRQNKQFGIISFCCGGGQGVAMLIEREG